MYSMCCVTNAFTLMKYAHRHNTGQVKEANSAWMQFPGLCWEVYMLEWTTQLNHLISVQNVTGGD